MTEPPFKTAFPDTAFRAKLDSEAVDADFLQAIWASRVVREQVLAVARTTNGTFKVNEQHLKTIDVPILSRPQQENAGRIFSHVVTLMNVARQRHTCAVELYNALRDPAFKGEL